MKADPMRKQAFFGLLLLMASALAFPVYAHDDTSAAAQAASRPIASRLANAAELRTSLRLAPAYDKVAGVESVKIAILDYGFDGIESDRRYLPENAVVVENYDPAFIQRFKLGDPEFKKPFAPGNAHGRNMAQIIWGITGFQPQGPKFFLLNANGPTMLRRAVRYAIEAHIDVILFSNNFEGGGYGDGRGPINRVVADALAADILWINAAGNFGGHVYNGRVRIGPDGYLQLGTGKEATALRFRNLLDENTVTVTLTWNDYRDQEDAGTNKDLDLYIEDADGKRIGSSEKTQITGAKIAGPEESRNPRERVVLTNLPAQPGREYRIRIRAKKNNFTADDQVRVLVAGSRFGVVDRLTDQTIDGVQFLDASGKGEVYPPADNPLVLAVGDGDAVSSVGPTADHRVKPDIIIEDSRAYFTNGEVTFGASNAAAFFAGTVALMKAAEPGLRTRHLLWFAHYGRANRIETSGRPAITSTVAGSTVMVLDGNNRVRRIWQTPSLQELKQQVHKDG